MGAELDPQVKRQGGDSSRADYEKVKEIVDGARAGDAKAVKELESLEEDVYGGFILSETVNRPVS